MSKSKKVVIIPLRVTPDLQQEIKTTAKEVGLSQADTMRKSIESGMPVLVRMLGKKATAAA